MSFWFGTDKTIKCPRCLKKVRIPRNLENGLACQACKFVLPSEYINYYQYMPPVFVQLFGLPAAGKTMFLDILRLNLYDMAQAWAATGFYAQPITQLDSEHKIIIQDERAKGLPPGSTPKRDRMQNEVYIMALRNMPRWGSRFLVVMDHAGEQFGKLHVEVEEIPFLRHTPVTILLLSLPDLLRDRQRIDNLINSYIASLEKYGVNFARERRQLIIVLSKADLITNLSSELANYLSSDSIYAALIDPRQNFRMGDADIENYLRWMTYISNLTMKWINDNVLSGPAMLHMLRDKGITARFTVMSATGHPLSNDGNNLEPTPRRVLDPFFWVLEYYSQNGL